MPLRPIDISIAGPYDRGFWTTPEMYNPPIFRTGEVAKFFFAQPYHWMSYQINTVGISLDGVPLQLPSDERGERMFRLFDVERFAHGLFQSGRLRLVPFYRTIELVKIVAWNYGYIDLPMVSEIGRETAVPEDELVDDLDGAPGAELHKIVLDEVTYGIALTPHHFAMLMEGLRPYLVRASYIQKRDQLDARVWARKQGYTVGERGPLPEGVQEAYDQAMQDH